MFIYRGVHAFRGTEDPDDPPSARCLTPPRAEPLNRSIPIPELSITAADDDAHDTVTPSSSPPPTAESAMPLVPPATPGRGGILFSRQHSRLGLQVRKHAMTLDPGHGTCAEDLYLTFYVCRRTLPGLPGACCSIWRPRTDRHPQSPNWTTPTLLSSFRGHQHAGPTRIPSPRAVARARRSGHTTWSSLTGPSAMSIVNGVACTCICSLCSTGLQLFPSPVQLVPEYSGNHPVTCSHPRMSTKQRTGRTTAQGTLHLPKPQQAAAC